MKAYTLRMDDDLLSAVKQIGLKEKKSVKDIILEALKQRIYGRASKAQQIKERKVLERGALLASRLSDQQVVASIREDRDR